MLGIPGRRATLEEAAASRNPMMLVSRCGSFLALLTPECAIPTSIRLSPTIIRGTCKDNAGVGCKRLLGSTNRRLLELPRANRQSFKLACLQDQLHLCCPLRGCTTSQTNMDIDVTSPVTSGS